MNSDALIATVRMNTTIEDSHPDYTAARILTELTDSLLTTFERAVVQCRNGYWCKPYLYTVTSGVSKYRIPARSCGVEKVEIGLGSPADFIKLPEISEVHAELYERASNVFAQPTAYVIRGDQVVLLPAPDTTSYSLRIWYYVRPSRLVTQQSTTIPSGTVRGQVTAISLGARQVTVNVVPFDQELAAPAAITSAVQRIDIVHPDGWHELALVGCTQTLAGSVFTLGGTDDMSEIAVGDFVRAAEQTDWPCLPDDYHRCLADVASVKILLQQDQATKAGGLAQSVNADISRFIEMIQPRVKSEAKTIRAPLPFLRGRSPVSG